MKITLRIGKILLAFLLILVRNGYEILTLIGRSECKMNKGKEEVLFLISMCKLIAV